MQKRLQLWMSIKSRQTKTAPLDDAAASPKWDGLCSKLCELYVLCARALGTVNDLKSNGIADLELIESCTLDVVGVEEKVLHLSLAGDETKSLVRDSLDCSVVHDFIYVCLIWRNSTRLSTRGMIPFYVSFVHLLDFDYRRSANNAVNIILLDTA
jgi:hypothetical protein